MLRTGVKLGLSKIITSVWGVRKGCCGVKLYVRERKCQEGRENYKLRAFVTLRPLYNMEKTSIT